MRTTLVLTWVAVLLALVAIAAVLHAARELAERRGRFVSAVTHELRTPLTTFCLYSQMLADGMVGDEASRSEYLGTLKSESQRLARIVENVLEFARLGRRTDRGRAEHLAVPALLERAMPRLEQRAAQCGMNAANSVDKRIEIAVKVLKEAVEFVVTDHGPGVEQGLRGLIFRPFQRGQSLAHAATPGLGLGLALSRGLARQLGGDLRLEASSGQGSRFVLTLPAQYPA
jgi:signal transduction histidine kinase